MCRKEFQINFRRCYCRHDLNVVGNRLEKRIGSSRFWRSQKIFALSYANHDVSPGN